MNKDFLKFRSILFIFLLSLPLLSFIQSKYHIIHVKKLGGAITPNADTTLTPGGWFSGLYQQKTEKFLNDTFGFRNTLVRINNQVAFNLFGQAYANGIIIGKDNYLYEDGYIRSYTGEDFIGNDSITHRMERIKFLQDTLCKLGKTLVVILAPGKGFFYPEYIPDGLKAKRGPTNYDYTTRTTKALDINCIDFNKYFMDNKYKTPFPLMTRYGIHWSFYGECIVSDSMVKYVETKRHCRLPHLYWTSVDSAEARGQDHDIEVGMNLLFKLKGRKLGYPVPQYETDSGKTKPSLMTIGDSFFWGIEEVGISGRCFSKNSFWYYNAQIYSNTADNNMLAEKKDLRKALDDCNVLLLIGSDVNLANLGWGFIERAYNGYKYGIWK